jgi:hypothetical protein
MALKRRYVIQIDVENAAYTDLFIGIITKEL